MKRAAMILQMLIRLLGLGMIGLGLMFWSGNSLNLIPLHMRLGEVLVALIWILCGIAMRGGVSMPFVLGVILYGVFVVGFAMRMGGFMPDMHEMVRVLHFVIGLVAIGAAEMVGAKIKRV
ncbi:MAG: hypothetical protein ABL967_13260 [Bryobacteraceae bacterium]